MRAMSNRPSHCLRQPRAVVRCCNLGMIVLALSINFAPPLFIPFREAFGLSYEQLGRLVLVNYTTQVTFDLLCGALSDRLPPRLFVMAANVLAFTGLWLLSFAETLFPASPYAGLLLGTVVCAMGGGIMELMLTPIVNAVPSRRKTANMNMLHAYYALGQLVVVGGIALAVSACGPSRWPWIVRAWSLVPLVSGLCFACVHIPKFVPEASRQRLRHLIRTRFLLVAIAAIALGGGAEAVMAQWTSAFAEQGLGFAKISGDLLGCCLFAAMLGAGRLWMGVAGERVNLGRLMIGCTLLLAACYLLAALAPLPWLSLAACALGGLGASILWPGVLVLCARRYPLGGGSMFATLSAAGDLGCALVPWALGGLAVRIGASSSLLNGLRGLGIALTPDQAGLRAAFLAATLAPLLLFFLINRLRGTLPAARCLDQGIPPPHIRKA
jgi:MFS family permease